MFYEMLTPILGVIFLQKYIYMYYIHYVYMQHLF